MLRATGDPSARWKKRGLFGMTPRATTASFFMGPSLQSSTLAYAFTMESGFQCASCGEWNVTSVDESAGRRQSYVEDCQVCCKPNVLRVEYDNSSQEFFIAAELE